jgi:hypothetical protein
MWASYKSARKPSTIMFLDAATALDSYWYEQSPSTILKMNRTILQEIVSKVISGLHGGFIAIDDLQTVWATEERLEAFLKQYPRLALATEQIEFVQRNLLRTISLLLFIDDIDWEGVVHPWIRKCIDNKTDCDAKLHMDGDLEHRPPGLSEGQLQIFRMQRHLFTAVIIEETKDYELEPGQILPFKKDVVNIGRGGNGVVQRFVVAPGHLVLKKVGFTTQSLSNAIH